MESEKSISLRGSIETMPEKTYAYESLADDAGGSFRRYET